MVKETSKKYVQEYKRKCNECGKVWHSLVTREDAIKKNVGCSGCITASTALGGNLGAAAQSKRSGEAEQNLLDKLRKCPNCGSSNYNEEIMNYEREY